MSAVSRLLGTGTALVLLATGLRAQTLPMPELPAEPPTEAQPTAPAGTPPKQAPARPEPIGPTSPAPPPPWQYELGLGFRWDSNIDFLVPNGPEGFAIVPRGTVARIFRGRRGELRAQANGRWIGYTNQKDLSRGDVDFALQGSYRSSPSTSWQGNVAYAFGHTDSSQVLQDQGVLLQLAKVRTLAGSLGLSHQLGARTALRIGGRIYRTDFGTPEATQAQPSVVLRNGQSVRGTIDLERRLSPRNSAALEYAAEDVTSGQTGRNYLTHFVSLQGTRVLSPRSALLLEAGVSYTADPVRAGLGTTTGFYGGATFRRQVKHSNLTAYVRREVAPAFGIGGSLREVRAGLNAVIPMGRAWELQAAFNHIQPEKPVSGGYYYAGDDALLALSRGVGRNFRISGEAGYRRRGATSTNPSIDAFEAGLFLTLVGPAGGGGARTPAR